MSRTASANSILLREYIRDIADTDKLKPELEPALLGLFGEVGSLVTTAKKHMRDDDAYTGYRRAVIEEFGDTLWYLAALCRRLSVDLEEIMLEASNGYGSALAASDLGDGPLAHIAAPASLGPQNEVFLALGEAATALLVLRANPSAHRPLLIAFADCYLKALHASGAYFASVVRGNLKKARGRFLPPDYAKMPTFDAALSADEQLPQHFEFRIAKRPSGRTHMQWNGVFVGDPLTDNIADPDGYRYHDVFHLAHGAVLHWSPVFRALIKQKRKSDPALDEAQDGGRAIVVEEGLTAWIYGQAKDLNYFEGQTKVSFDLLKTVGQFVRGYEVDACPLSLWEIAILKGYEVFRQVRANEGGYVIGDRAARTIEYRPLDSGSGA